MRLSLTPTRANPHTLNQHNGQRLPPDRLSASSGLHTFGSRRATMGRVSGASGKYHAHGRFQSKKIDLNLAPGILLLNIY